MLRDKLLRVLSLFCMNKMPLVLQIAGGYESFLK